MIKRVFLDASFLVALLRLDDPNHKDAQKIAEDIGQFSSKNGKQDFQLFINYLVVAESVTVLSQRVGKRTAKEVLINYQNEEFIEIEINRQIQNRAQEIFETSKSKNLPFFDTVHFATMESVGLDTVLTFDKHFKKHGFVIW